MLNSGIGTVEWSAYSLLRTNDLLQTNFSKPSAKETLRIEDLRTQQIQFQRLWNRRYQRNPNNTLFQLFHNAHVFVSVTDLESMTQRLNVWRREDPRFRSTKSGSNASAFQERDVSVPDLQVLELMNARLRHHRRQAQTLQEKLNLEESGNQQLTDIRCVPKDQTLLILILNQNSHSNLNPSTHLNLRLKTPLHASPKTSSLFLACLVPRKMQTERPRPWQHHQPKFPQMRSLQLTSLKPIPPWDQALQQIQRIYTTTPSRPPTQFCLTRNLRAGSERIRSCILFLPKVICRWSIILPKTTEVIRLEQPLTWLLDASTLRKKRWEDWQSEQRKQEDQCGCEDNSALQNCGICIVWYVDVIDWRMR